MQNKLYEIAGFTAITALFLTATLISTNLLLSACNYAMHLTSQTIAQ